MQTKRDTLIDTALALFAEHGFHATGVDRIRDATGISKVTLYKYFPTKDDLIAAVLERRHADFMAGLDDAVAKDRRLRAVFDWHADWFARADFRGCLFMRVAAEFPDPDHPLRRIATAHKQQVRALLERLLSGSGTPEAARKADALLLVLEGMIVRAVLQPDSQPADTGWRIACAIAG